MKKKPDKNYLNKITTLLLKLPRKVKNQYILLLVFSICVAALEVVVITTVALVLNPEMTNKFSTDLFLLGDAKYIDNLSFVFASIALLCIVRIFLAFHTAHVNASIGHALSLYVYKNIFSWEFQSFENENKNEIVADLIVKINQTVGRIIRPLTQLSISLVILSALIPIMFAQNPLEVLSLCALSLTIYLTFSFMIKRKRSEISLIISRNTNKLSQHIRESLDGFILIKKQNLFADFNNKYAAIDKDLRVSSDLSLAFGVVPKYFLEFSALALIIVFANGDSRGLLDYSFFLVALFRVAPLFQQLFLSLHSFRTFSHVLDDILHRLDTKNDYKVTKLPIFDPAKENNFGSDLKINIGRSSFDRNADTRINFPEINMKVGGLNLLKGVSGAGKTTLFNCILGLYKFSMVPTITLSQDNSVSKPFVNFWSDDAFYISQETILFENSLRENLVAHKGSVEPDILDLILNITGLSAFLNLDSMILENGKNLSGGQKQRICLARALVAKKLFIFIDEGLNALDHLSQKQLVTDIRRNFPWITIMMISHDNNFDDVADEINII